MKIRSLLRTQASFSGSLLLVIGLLFPVWCAAQNYPSSVTALVARTKAQVKTIDMATFKSALERNRLGLIVDVREPAEYADGQIPGAINIPRGLIEFRIWPHVGFRAFAANVPRQSPGLSWSNREGSAYPPSANKKAAL